MRVLGLAGSPRPRDSITLKLVEAGLLGASEAGADVELVEIAHLSVRRCRGCGECFRTGRCGQDDDIHFLIERMAAADGIILGSPAYAGGVTSPVECMMERMGDAAHCRRFEGKYGFSIAVSHDGNERFVAAYMSRFLSDRGVLITGGQEASVDKKGVTESAIADAKALGSDLVAAIREKRSYPGQDEARSAFLREFRETVVANRELWPHDYRYWLQKGWV